MTRTRQQLGRGPWHQAAVLIFAITVLLACKLVEEVKLNKDGSGTYRAELLLVGDEKQMLRAVKEELAKKPQFEILDEGFRGNDYYLVVGMSFQQIGEISDNSEDSWSVTEAGAFKKRARLEVSNRGQDQTGLDEHLLEVTMPGTVVETNAEKVSANKVVWDRLAAGSREKLYVEAEYMELPAGYVRKIWLAAAVLILGIVLLVVLRLRKREK